MRRQHLLVAILVVGLTTAACEVFGLPTPGAELCARVAPDYSGTVVGSFNTTVGSVRALEPRAAQPQRWPDLAPDHAAVLCYIDGEIAKAPPPGPNGEVSEPFDRAVIAIVDGHSELIIAGYRDLLPIRAP